MPAPYDPKSIANYFLDLAQTRGQYIDPMKLQKLIYYAHGWFAGYTGQPLIDENVEAWPYGPVIPSVYSAFRAFGNNPITSRARSRNHGEAARPTESDTLGFLSNVWDSYGQYTGARLSDMTHAPGSPWDMTRRQTLGARDTPISFELIRQHFAEAVQNAAQAQLPASAA